MFRDDYVLSYSVSKSGIEYFEDRSGDILLTDSSDPDRREMDTLEESLAFTGNDSLVLRGDQGVKLGLAKACADDLSKLLTVMGLEGCPDVITIRVRRLGEPDQK